VGLDAVDKDVVVDSIVSNAAEMSRMTRAETFLMSAAMYTVFMMCGSAVFVE